MQQTDIERIARQTALHAAIDNARGGTADNLVADAEEFRKFLTNTTTTEGNK